MTDRALTYESDGETPLPTLPTVHLRKRKAKSREVQKVGVQENLFGL